MNKPDPFLGRFPVVVTTRSLRETRATGAVSVADRGRVPKVPRGDTFAQPCHASSVFLHQKNKTRVSTFRRLNLAAEPPHPRPERF